LPFCPCHAKYIKKIAAFIMALIKLWQSSSKDFLNSTFMSRLNFIFFHLAHEQNLSLCMNIAVTYWLVKMHLEEQMLVAGKKTSRQAQLPCQPVCFLCPLLEPLWYS
jgi:hypothetical protein